MEGFTQEEKDLLLQGVDIMISQVSQQVNQTQKLDEKSNVRKALKTMFDLSNKVEELIKVKK